MRKLVQIISKFSKTKLKGELFNFNENRVKISKYKKNRWNFIKNGKVTGNLKI